MFPRFLPIYISKAVQVSWWLSFSRLNYVPVQLLYVENEPLLSL